MKKLNIKIRLTLVFLILVFSSLTSKGQEGEIVTPDSQYRLVPLPTLQYSNFVGKPIATIGDVIVFKDDRQDPKKVHDINGKSITFGIFGVNTKTGKFLFVDGLNDLGYLVYQSNRKHNSNEFYMVSTNQTKLYKVIVSQDTITTETIYNNLGTGLITAFTEYLNELIIAESGRGIKILNSDNSLKKFIPYSVEYSSLAQYGDLIIFGGYSHGVIFSVNIETGEIQDIRSNTGTINGAFVTTINNQLYADVDGEIYKKNTNDNDWTKIVSGINPQTLKYNAILGEYTLRTKVGEDYIFRNDSLISIPVNPHDNIIYLENYTEIIYQKYGRNIGHSSWYVFPLNGKLYGIGDGMVGTIQRVLMPGEDTTSTGFSKIQLPKLTVYPNPAINILNISNLEKDNVEVSITNSIGKVVLLVKTKDSIDISLIPSGLYFVNIEGFSPSKFYKK